MGKDSFVAKDLTKFLSANASYLIKLFIFLFIFIYSATPVLHAEPVYADAKVAARDMKSGNEKQKLKKHILIITSQPYVTDWFYTLNNALRKNLLSFLSPDSKLSYEYIGSESLTDSDYNIKLVAMLKEKYVNIKLDMVIAILPVSSQFVLDRGESVFPGIAAVFVLPSKKQIPKISVRPQSGLIKSAVNAIPDTIERIRVLLPETEHLIVASGSGADDLNYQSIAKDALVYRGWPKAVEYLSGLPAEDLAVRLERLPEKSAVLMLTYLQDQKGAPLTTVQVMKIVSARTHAPIFSFYDTIFGLGIVGGKLTSAEAYGDAAAETALKIFKGERALPIVETAAEARDIYDWRQIEKWNIPKDRLPAGSDIRYRKITFWEEHRDKIILVACIIVLQGILILTLLFNLFRRKRAEAALSLSAKKYYDIFNNSVMGIFQSTPQGKFLNVNPAFAKLFGYETPENLLEDIHDIQNDVYVNPDERVRFKKLFAEEGAVRGFQAEFRRRDGTRFWISITGTAIRDRVGNILYYEGTIEDITQQKQAENELMKHQEHLEELVRERTSELEIAKTKAESSDRLKSAFLATMSHELRTPLNSIIGFTGILLQHLAGPLNAEQDKQLHMVYNSAKHLLDLINDVLDISKIEARQLNVISETFDLRDCVEKVIKSSQPSAGKKGIELSATIAPGIGEIKSDRRRVEQILLNLISNAVKFTEQGSVRLNCTVSGNKIVLAVCDSGIGIKQEDMGLLFNAFRQIESGLTRKYDGTGLGLSISKKLANLLGGEIEVESVWGTGSTFRLMLPNEGEKA